MREIYATSSIGSDSAPSSARRRFRCTLTCTWPLPLRSSPLRAEANGRFVGPDAAGIFLRQAAMDRHAVARERAAEDFAVLGQVGQQPAVGDVGFDVDVEKVLRQRHRSRRRQPRQALARLRR